MLIDSHCHIDSPEFAEDLSSIFNEMELNGVKGALTVCCSLREFPRCLSFADLHKNIWCTVGVHPSTEDDLKEATIEEIVLLSKANKAVGIGECGLDYYYNKEPLDWQRERFALHIQAARKAKLPVVVHSRAANEDTMKILRDNCAEECGFVLHCFCGDLHMAQVALEMGGYISFSGIVTFKNAAEIQRVASSIPLEKILVETDCPYLAPVPFRGKRNDPSKVIYVAKKIAELRSISLEEVEEASTENFFRLFSKARYES